MSRSAHNYCGGMGVQGDTAEIHPTMKPAEQRSHSMWTLYRSVNCCNITLNSHKESADAIRQAYISATKWTETIDYFSLGSSGLHKSGHNFEDAHLTNTVDTAIFDWRTQLNTEQVILLEWRSVSTVRSLALTPLLFCQKQHPSTNHLSAPPVKAATRRWVCTSLGSEALYLIQIKWKSMWGRHRKS